MPDLKDGDSVEMQGSGGRPYVLKNVGGVYSCSCPAWRNQSIAIERRTCKHLRRLRGDAAEEARIGAALPAAPKEAAGDVQAPPLLLAEPWDGASSVTGWWLSEKLDGVRAYWDGSRFLSRLGNPFHAPGWFTAGLPPDPLDGELWLARKAFQRTVGIVRRQDQTDLWKEVRYLVFDAPAQGAGFEQRLRLVQALLKKHSPPYATAHPHAPCRGIDHLREELARVEAVGGEGLMLRQPGSRYAAGRSSTLLKVKSFLDAEARVVGHEAGRGRHKGRLGALLVELADGTRFAVGTGFSDAERGQPPPVGSLINFRYQELSDAGVPRFPSFVGVRQDTQPSPAIKKGELPLDTATPAAPRRFEFSAGNSTKFWELTVRDAEVTVRYGRIGTQGQTNVKSFPDQQAAARHADKLIHEKTDKGYREVR
ncbi:MAG TPA: DNA ligase [Gemmataceae bacterium]|jgi:DNA ligase-1|nr:DNA ligase [Gemmataceae bacterium]